MFVLPKRNIIFKAGENQSFKLSNGIMADVPDWVANSKYFDSLVKDGKIVVAASTKDRDIDKAVIKADVAEKVAKDKYKKSKAEPTKD